MTLSRTSGQAPAVAENQVSNRQVVRGRTPLSRSLTGRLLPLMVAGAGDGDPPPASSGEGGGAGAAASTGIPPTKEPEDFDPERAIATIRKLREENKTLKGSTSEREDLRKKVKDAEDAQLSETERAKYEATEHGTRAEKMEAELREERTRSAIERAASKAKFIDTASAFRLIDSSAITHDAFHSSAAP